jgi:hypothetical protein
MRERWLSATVCAVGIATITACGSTGTIERTHTASQATAAAPTVARPLAATSYPVQQLPPGHITLAEARTPRGPVAIALHRIRYFGHVSLCVSETDAGGGSDQSCANYPIGPKSNQNIGTAPVWWAANLLMACTKPRFQVVSGVVLRRGVTAWLRTPAGVSRMPTAAVPKAFGVAGGLVYATISTAPDSVTLRDADGKTVYAASVAPITSFPRLGCGSARSGAGETSPATASGFVASSAGQHVVP